MGLHGREDQSTNTTCLFSPACRTTAVPSLPSKARNSLEPSPDCDLQCIPQPRAKALPLRRAQPSSRSNYYLGRSRRIATDLEVGNSPLFTGVPGSSIAARSKVPIKQKARSPRPGFFIAKAGGTIDRFRIAEKHWAFKGESSPMGMRIRKLSGVVQDADSTRH